MWVFQTASNFLNSILSFLEETPSFFFFFFQNIRYFLQSLNIVSRKEIFWIHGPFNFRNMSTIAGWSFTEAGDGIGGILAILDNNMLIPIAAIERFRN